MLVAEVRQAPQDDAVFLVSAGELQPELHLRRLGRGAATGNEHAQRFRPLRTGRMQPGLQ